MVATTSSQPRPPSEPSAVTRSNAVEGIAHRQSVGERLERRGHLLPGDEQAAEQELGEDECGHELRLNSVWAKALASRPSAIPRIAVAIASNTTAIVEPAASTPSRPKATAETIVACPTTARTRSRSRAAGRLRQRQRHQPLERARGSLAQPVIEVTRNITISGNRPTSGPPTRSKALLALEHVLEQEDQDAGDDDDHRQRAQVAPRCSSTGGRADDPRRHAPGPPSFGPPRSASGTPRPCASRCAGAAHPARRRRGCRPRASAAGGRSGRPRP